MGRPELTCMLFFKCHALRLFLSFGFRQGNLPLAYNAGADLHFGLVIHRPSRSSCWLCASYACHLQAFPAGLGTALAMLLKSVSDPFVAKGAMRLISLAMLRLPRQPRDPRRSPAFCRISLTGWLANGFLNSELPNFGESPGCLDTLPQFLFSLPQ